MVYQSFLATLNESCRRCGSTSYRQEQGVHWGGGSSCARMFFSLQAHMNPKTFFETLVLASTLDKRSFDQNCLCSKVFRAFPTMSAEQLYRHVQPLDSLRKS